METVFYICPVVWEFESGLTVAIFLDRDRAEAVARAAPEAPAGGWGVFPMIELELLAWLREQRAQGVSQLLLDPGVLPDKRSMGGCYCIELADWILDTRKALALFRKLGDIYVAGDDSASSP